MSGVKSTSAMVDMAEEYQKQIVLLTRKIADEGKMIDRKLEVM